MDRELFYTYFERAFFSSKAQDIIKSKEAMKSHLGDSAFIQHLLTDSGKNEMLDFLNSEYEIDEWETLTEFFVENAIIMLDVTGYYKFFGPDSLEDLETVYRELIKDMHRVMQLDHCTIENLQNVLELQSMRLSNYLVKTSFTSMSL